MSDAGPAISAGVRKGLLAELAGVTPRTITAWRRQGMPVGRKWECGPETLLFLAARVSHASPARADPVPSSPEDLRRSQIELNEQKTRIEAARAAELEGSLVARADVLEGWRLVLTRVRERVLACALRISRRGWGVSSRAALKEVAEEELALALEELSDAGGAKR